MYNKEICYTQGCIINKIRNGPELRKGSLQFEMRFIKLTCYLVGETVRRQKRREEKYHYLGYQDRERLSCVSVKFYDV